MVPLLVHIMVNRGNRAMWPTLLLLYLHRNLWIGWFVDWSVQCLISSSLMDWWKFAVSVFSDLETRKPNFRWTKNISLRKFSPILNHPQNHPKSISTLSKQKTNAKCDDQNVADCHVLRCWGKILLKEMQQLRKALSTSHLGRLGKNGC